MIYAWHLDDNREIYLQNEGTQTSAMLREPDAQGWHRLFETGRWSTPPILLRTSTDELVLQISTARGHIFLRVDAQGLSFLKSPPILIGSEILPHEQVSQE